MDHLPYDLVEEVISYLPLSDVQTIARVASRRQTLENWSCAAEDQLENRVLLDVYACVQCEPVTRKVESSEGFVFSHNIVESRIFLSATRVLPNGDKEEWNFCYGWIQNLTVETSFEDSEECPYPQVDLQKALSLVSLPVDPSARGSLTVQQHLAYSRVEEEHDVYRRMINAVQKEFVKVKLIDREGYFSNTMKELAIGFLNKEAFLEDMDLKGCHLPPDAMADISGAVASEFRRKRGRPLEVRMPFNCEEIVSIVESIAENWHQSDGALEEKRVAWRRFHGDLWFAIAAIVDPDGLFEYLPHPTRRSSLFVSRDDVRVVKFQPWHVPVRFEWIESVIAEWKNGSGFYVHRGERDFVFNFESESECLKFEENYGAQWLLSVAHPSKLLYLEITKHENMVAIRVEHGNFSEEGVESLISDWKKGNGESLINGLTEIELRVHLPRFDNSRVPQVRRISHPTANARCVIVLMKCHLTPVFSNRVERISISSIDPEDVDDWNLQLLFGSLRL